MGERERYPVGTFCWVDLVSGDQAAAASFYGELLGWDVPDGDRHVHARLGGRDVAGLYTLPDTPPHWTSYVTVDDADATAARAAELGDHPGAGLVNDVGCWCSNQLQAPDPPLDFYRDWLGWEVEPQGEGYWAVNNAGADNGGILAVDGPAAWVVYFHVEDADASTEAAQSAGATVLFAPETIGLGRIAILADPQGAAFGLFAGATDP
jgi:uncharacterized protein